LRSHDRCDFRARDFLRISRAARRGVVTVDAECRFFLMIFLPALAVANAVTWWSSSIRSSTMCRKNGSSSTMGCGAWNSAAMARVSRWIQQRGFARSTKVVLRFVAISAAGSLCACGS
jgi:hypothetical protein